MTLPSDDDIPLLAITNDDEHIVALLRTLQRAVLLHPEATRALFQSLVREGRLFAQTADGERWKQRIARSALVSRAQLVAQAASFWMLDDDQPGATPSGLVEAIASAASAPGRDELLERLLRGLEDAE
jgi:hypothetical protein